jgi:hypothetical protein
MILLPWLRCNHRRLSGLVTLAGDTYQVCLDCGAELEYDLETMQATGVQIEREVVHPDYVHIARQVKAGRGRKRDQLAPERSITR